MERRWVFPPPKIADGLILLCQARARSDLCIETFEIRAADAATTKRLPCRIERAVPLSHDVMGLFLRLPIAEEFSFEAGQYIDILLPGRPAPQLFHCIAAARRSAAGAACTARRRRRIHRPAIPRGHALEPCSPSKDPWATLRIGRTPPHRPAHAAHRAAARALRRCSRFCVTSSRTESSAACGSIGACAAEQDLYAHATLEQLSRRAAAFSYVPVLSEAGPDWRGATGWVHEAALRGVQDLEAVEVYAAGPPAMIAAIQGEYDSRAQRQDRGCTLIPSTTPRTRSSANGSAPPPNPDPPPNPPAAAAP